MPEGKGDGSGYGHAAPEHWWWWGRMLRVGATVRLQALRQGSGVQGASSVLPTEVCQNLPVQEVWFWARRVQNSVTHTRLSRAVLETSLVSPERLQWAERRRISANFPLKHDSSIYRPGSMLHGQHSLANIIRKRNRASAHAQRNLGLREPLHVACALGPTLAPSDPEIYPASKAFATQAVQRASGTPKALFVQREYKHRVQPPMRKVAMNAAAAALRQLP